jgi:Rrf2 family transcriptional regulator, iron-sulfur cluster assembly transcription factor
MKFSTRSRYGTRLMLYLARHYGKGPVKIGEVARDENISVKYLEQLIIPLKRGGIIRSIRGPKGGYELAVDPEKVTIGWIIEALEGQILLSDCVAHPEQCPRSGSCLTRDLWKDASDAVYATFDSVTLAAELRRGKTGNRKSGKGGEL